MFFFVCLFFLFFFFFFFGGGSEGFARCELLLSLTLPCCFFLLRAGQVLNTLESSPEPPWGMEARASLFVRDHVSQFSSCMLDNSNNNV